MVHFDQRLRVTTYDAFVAAIEERAPLAGILMTPDAAFGYERAGTPEALAELGRSRGFEVVVVPPFELDGRPVRSTEVRAAIAAGDLARASHLLGRAHCVAGVAVARSAGQGSLLRFPLPVALPPDGTYPVEVGPAPRRRPGRGGHRWRIGPPRRDAFGTVGPRRVHSERLTARRVMPRLARRVCAMV